MYILGELPSDLDKQGSPMIPPPPWFGPGISWDIPVKVESSGLGSTFRDYRFWIVIVGAFALLLPAEPAGAPSPW